MGNETVRWFRTDEHSYAVTTAEYASKRFREFCDDWQALPWAILALFNSAQAALVGHLTGTAGLGALQKDCAEETYAALKGEGAYPDEKLADFKELLKRACNSSRQIEEAGGQIDLAPSDRQALDRLLKLRREFAHFSPKGWSVEISGLPDIGRSWVRLMRGVHRAGWALRHCDDGQRKTFEVSVSKIETLASRLFR